ncbi:MAG: OprO/OprP family phosphate-selective porin [Myxococcota bacterium]
MHWNRSGAVRFIALCVSTVIWAGSAAAAEKSVAEEILDLLLDSGQISEKQHEALSERARAEARRRASASTGALAATAADPEGYKVRWSNGLMIDRNDKQFRLKIGGRIQNDWAVFTNDGSIKNNFGNPDSGTELRRARIYFSGTLYDRVIFKAQYDFVGGDVDFNDVYIGLKGLPGLGTVKVGHFKEPFSLDNMTSSKYVTFMERSLPHVFIPGRNTGIQVGGPVHDQRMTWHAGAFRQTDSFANAVGDDDAWDLTTRVTGLPLYEDGGRNLVHVGGSYSHQFRHNMPVRYKQRPAAHLAPFLWDTGAIDGDDVDLMGLEFAWIHGPLSLQSEYMHAFVDVPGTTRDFWGVYAQASYFLTGENRKYNPAAGAFVRVTPRENFNPAEGTWGAFEVGARYSRLDLEDSNLSGGRGDEVTVGLNWHLFPALRVSTNWLWARRSNFGDLYGWETRFQLEF